MRPSHFALFSSCFALALATPSIARADELDPPPPARERFGHPGQIMVDDVAGVSMISTPTFGPLGGGSPYLTGAFVASTASSDLYGTKSKFNYVAIRPSVDVFVADRFSVGGSVTASLVQSRMTQTPADDAGYLHRINSLGLSFEPRVGVAFRLAESLSLWPRVGVGYHRSWTTTSDRPPEQLGVFSTFTHVGLIAHLGRFAYLDVGPDAQLTLMTRRFDDGARAESTSASLGLSAALGLMF